MTEINAAVRLRAGKVSTKEYKKACEWLVQELPAGAWNDGDEKALEKAITREKPDAKFEVAIRFAFNKADELDAAS